MVNILSQITLKVKFLRNEEQHCLLPSLVDDFTCVHSKNALLTHILSTLFSSTSSSLLAHILALSYINTTCAQETPFVLNSLTGKQPTVTANNSGGYTTDTERDRGYVTGPSGTELEKAGRFHITISVNALKLIIIQDITHKTHQHIFIAILILSPTFISAELQMQFCHDCSEPPLDRQMLFFLTINVSPVPVKNIVAGTKYQLKLSVLCDLLEIILCTLGSEANGNSC